MLLHPFLKLTQQYYRSFLKHYSLKFGSQHLLLTYKRKVVKFTSLFCNSTLVVTTTEQITKETSFYNTNTFYVCVAVLATVAVGGLVYYYFWSTAVAGASAALAGSANSPTSHIDSVPDINSIVPDNTASHVIGNPTTDVAQIVVDIPSNINPLVNHPVLPNALSSQLSNRDFTPSTSSMCDSVTSSSSSLPDVVAPLSKVSTILSDQAVAAASNLVDTMQTVSAATSATASATVAVVNYGLRYALGPSTSVPTTTSTMHTLHTLAAEGVARGLNLPGASLFGNTNRITSTANVPLDLVLPDMTIQGLQILKNQSSPAVSNAAIQTQSQSVNTSNVAAEVQFPDISSTPLEEFYNASNFLNAVTQFKDSLEYSREALLTHPGTMPFFKPICTLSLDNQLLTIFNLGEVTAAKFAFLCTLPLALVLASKWFNSDFILYLNNFQNSQFKKYLQVLQILYYPLLVKAVAISKAEMTLANNVMLRRLVVSVERFSEAVEAIQKVLPNTFPSPFFSKVAKLLKKVSDLLSAYKFYFPGT